MRLFLFGHLSLQAEYRWIPGDEVIEHTGYLYSKDGWDYYSNRDTRMDKIV